jgi:hypothetical protein
VNCSSQYEQYERLLGQVAYLTKRLGIKNKDHPLQQDTFEGSNSAWRNSRIQGLTAKVKDLEEKVAIRFGDKTPEDDVPDGSREVAW